MNELLENEVKKKNTIDCLRLAVGGEGKLIRQNELRKKETNINRHCRLDSNCESHFSDMNDISERISTICLVCMQSIVQVRA